MRARKSSTHHYSSPLPHHKKSSRRYNERKSRSSSIPLLHFIKSMFAAIDRTLVKYAPPWYRTPTVQAATLGIVFFWVFAAYTTVQFYSASTYGPELAADCVSAVYLTFTLTCLVSPGIINKFGCRVSMFVGVLGYANLVLASLIYFQHGGENVRWARRLVVAGGAILGIGASMLWTAQGRLILQYASKAEELESNKSFQMENNSSIGNCNYEKSNNPSMSRTRSYTGSLMSIFWAIFQCSSLVGGSISFVYYNQKPEGSTSLYTLFLGFILIGAIFSQFLLPPCMLRSKDTANDYKDLELKSEQTPLTVDVESIAEYARGESQHSSETIKEDLSQQSWLEEARGTIRIVLTREMVSLSLLFLYTGFNQPYQQATFGNRFFTKRSIGAELIIFHLMEILGAIIVGWFLDNDKSHHDNQRKRAIICLGSFILINGAANIIAFCQEISTEHIVATQHDILEMRAIVLSSAFAMWGFADAQIQVYSYWLIGCLYKTGDNHSRAVGWYKCEFILMVCVYCFTC